MLRPIRDELAAFREGAGPDVDILVDLNFNFKTEGFLKVARAIEPFDIFWVEIDTRDAKALAYIRRGTRDPGGLLRVPLRPARLPAVLRARSRWTWPSSTRRGTASAESLKIAAMADAYEVNVAPHNFYGHLATMMNAHFCAVAPNLRIMEIDPDTVPWYDDLVTAQARDQGWASAPADPAGLGHRGQRGQRRRAHPAAESR